jgi:hippurate hydrolase
LTILRESFAAPAATPRCRTTARDPIPAIGPFVDGLSHVAARETDTRRPAVFSVTIVRAGSADKSCRPRRYARARFRTLSARRATRHASVAARGRGRRSVARPGRGGRRPRRLSRHQPRRRGCLVEASARSLELRVHTDAAPFMGAEDFSYMLERVSGALVISRSGGTQHAPEVRCTPTS